MEALCKYLKFVETKYEKHKYGLYSYVAVGRLLDLAILEGFDDLNLLTEKLQQHFSIIEKIMPTLLQFSIDVLDFMKSYKWTSADEIVIPYERIKRRSNYTISCPELEALWKKYDNMLISFGLYKIPRIPRKKLFSSFTVSLKTVNNPVILFELEGNNRQTKIVCHNDYTKNIAKLTDKILNKISEYENKYSNYLKSILKSKRKSYRAG